MCLEKYAGWAFTRYICTYVPTYGQGTPWGPPANKGKSIHHTVRGYVLFTMLHAILQSATDRPLQTDHPIQPFRISIDLPVNMQYST